MITDDEVMRVLEQANPASVDDPIPMLDIAGYRDVLDATHTTMTLIDIEPEPIEPSNGRRWPILLASAAAVVVAIALVATRNDDATPADQPSPTVTVPPTAPARSMPNKFGPLAPGTYYVDEVSGTPTPRIYATIGTGWWDTCDGCGEGGLVKRDTDALFDTLDELQQHEIGSIGFSQPAAVFLDACHTDDLSYHRGPVTTLDGLVAALTEQKGWVDVTAPTDISIDGYAGKAFQRTAPADISDCDTMPSFKSRVMRGSPPYPIFVSWLSEPDFELERFSGSGPYDQGEIETLWVIDIDGTLVVISTRALPEPSAGATADFAADVLDSISIEHP